MRSNRGAIALFALLSMMFFLIFVMVAYNNVSQKSRTQVDTEGVLVNYYRSIQTAAERASSLTSTVKVSQKASTLKSNKDVQDYVVTGNVNKFVYSHGKVYKITN